MIFKRDLAEKVVAGEKTATRRKMSDNPRSPWYRGGCAYDVGQVFAVQPGRGVPRIADAEVTAVYPQPLGEMTEDDARKEGFRGANPDESPEERFAFAWEEINDNYDPAEEVHVVEFRVVQTLLDDLHPQEAA